MQSWCPLPGPFLATCIFNWLRAYFAANESSMKTPCRRLDVLPGACLRYPTELVVAEVTRLKPDPNLEPCASRLPGAALQRLPPGKHAFAKIFSGACLFALLLGVLVLPCRITADDLDDTFSSLVSGRAYLAGFPHGK